MRSILQRNQELRQNRISFVWINILYEGYFLDLYQFHVATIVRRGYARFGVDGLKIQYRGTDFSLEV